MAERRRRKEARPAEIIKAGLAEFAEHGFAGARLDNVARRAGISKGTIYLYFDSKEALFEAALASLTSGLFERAAADISLDGPMEGALRAILTRIYGAIATSDLPVLIQIIIAEGRRFPHITELYHRTVVAHGRKLLGTIVARGIEGGEFRDGPVRELPLVVMGPAVMTVVWKLAFDRLDPLPPGRVLDAHVDLVLNGLLAR
jgi:AcrR family transcriptional regulator